MDIKEKRNIIGWVGWFTSAILLGFLIPLAVMIGREWYQSYKYGQRVEKDDEQRYAMAILLGAALHYLAVRTIYL